MVDDVILNKTAVIERCVARAREEYNRDPKSFATDFTRQDAAVLNIQRACEAAIDLGHRVLHRDGLGVAQSARDVFTILTRAGRIEPALGAVLESMVGYRNIAVHDYQELLLPITIKVITHHLEDLLAYARAILQHNHNEAPL